MSLVVLWKKGSQSSTVSLLLKTFEYSTLKEVFTVIQTCKSIYELRGKQDFWILCQAKVKGIKLSIAPCFRVPVHTQHSLSLCELLFDTCRAGPPISMNVSRRPFKFIDQSVGDKLLRATHANDSGGVSKLLKLGPISGIRDWAWISSLRVAQEKCCWDIALRLLSCTSSFVTNFISSTIVVSYPNFSASETQQSSHFSLISDIDFAKIGSFLSTRDKAVLLQTCRGMRLALANNADFWAAEIRETIFTDSKSIESQSLSLCEMVSNMEEMRGHEKAMTLCSLRTSVLMLNPVAERQGAYLKALLEASIFGHLERLETLLSISDKYNDDLIRDFIKMALTMLTKYGASYQLDQSASFLKLFEGLKRAGREHLLIDSLSLALSWADKHRDDKVFNALMAQVDLDMRAKLLMHVIKVGPADFANKLVQKHEFAREVLLTALEEAQKLINQSPEYHNLVKFLSSQTSLCAIM